MRVVRVLAVTALASAAGLTSTAATVPAAAATPVVSASGDSADIYTDQFVNDTTRRHKEISGSNFLSFANHRAPAKLTGTEGTASAFVNQASTLETPASGFPVQPLNDIALNGTATAGSTGTGQASAVPNSDSEGTFDVSFTLDSPTPVFFSGFMQALNTDAGDSCSQTTVQLTGPDTASSRDFEAHTGTGCSAAGTRSKGWAESITLSAGDYDLNVDYITETDADELKAVSGSSTVSLNLAFMPPKAAFTTKLSGSKATFDASGSAPGVAGRPLASYRWTFGDGKKATTTSPTVTHTYPSAPKLAPNYKVLLQVVDNGGAVSAPVSHTVHGTATTLSVSKTAAKVKASGKVSPRRGGHHVVVTLARKSSGRFHTLATHRPTLTSTSSYATSFARPNPGTCRLTTRYPGDATHLASTRSKTFAC